MIADVKTPDNFMPPVSYSAGEHLESKSTRISLSTVILELFFHFNTAWAIMLSSWCCHRQPNTA